MNEDVAALQAQQDIHELIARKAPLAQVLRAIVGWMAAIMPEAVVSFMRVDAQSQTLSMVPDECFSERYIHAMQRLQPGEKSGTCGAAAFARETVITEDIMADPRWHAYRHLAQAENLRACWAFPVLSNNEELLGTFAAYHRRPTRPSQHALATLKRAAALTALAIVRDREVAQHRVLAEWHRSLFTNHPDGVYEFDLEGCFLRGNAALERITGYAESVLVGRHFNEFVDPECHALTQAAFDAACAGHSRHYETLGVHASGHAYRLEITNFPVTVDGVVVGVYGICRDISERKRHEAKMRLLERGMTASPNGIVMADATAPSAPLVYVNDAFCRLTGYTVEEALGRNCRFLQGPQTDPEAIEAIRGAVACRREIAVTLRNYRKDGTQFWNRLSISPVFDEQQHCTHFVGIQQDVTEQKEQAAQLAYQSNHDLLTGLCNRSALDDALAREFALHRSGDRTLVVLHVDLDGFRPINAGLGHHVGNQMLVAASKRLCAHAPEGATVARIVGDEFVVLLPRVRTRGEAIERVERVLESMLEPVENDGCALHVSASVGIACNDASVHQAHELLQHADMAVQEAKRQGGNTWHWYRGDQKRFVGDSVLLRHDLHAGLLEGQFELHYQPVVETVSGQVQALEALVRWHHPVRGLLSPGVFVPLAEETGQIVALGRWVLRTACREMVQLKSRSGRVLPVAVNISTLQFRRSGFVQEVERVLVETGLAPELLELEVTENVLVDGVEQAVEAIRALQAIGVKVALDDFGTGFSSLSYLRDLPIHKVKLDRAFIADILSNRNNAAIVQGVITMAHHMDLLVVAEGIETRAQQQDLARRNCHLLQGFLFARAQPLEVLERLPLRLPDADWPSRAESKDAGAA